MKVAQYMFFGERKGKEKKRKRRGRHAGKSEREDKKKMIDTECLQRLLDYSKSVNSHNRR
jgi:hypothetical protein